MVMATCEQAGPIDEAVLRASQIISSPNTLQIDDKCLGYSDHKHLRFWPPHGPDDREHGGLRLLSLDHGPGDTIDKVNMPYLRSMSQLTAAATALLTATPGSES